MWAAAPVLVFTGFESFWGGKGSKKGATIWGDRGEWTVARPRRRKAFEQSDGQRENFQAVQRRGRGREDHQRQKSRVRVQQGSDFWFSDMDDSDAFDVPVQTFDGRAALQYLRPGRTGREIRHYRTTAAAARLGHG